MDTAGGVAVPVIPPGLCYGEEAGCDIIFLAGRDDDIWRLPAHKFLLTQSTPVFHAMLSPRFLPPETPLPHTIPIPDIDGKALDNLLRFLYNEPVPLQSVETALMTLQASDKYMCPGLARLCISFLSDNLNQFNALAILKFIRVYCGDYQNLENLAKEKENSDVSPTTPCQTGRGNRGSSSKSKSRKSEANVLESATKLAESDFMMPAETIEMECAELLHKCLLVVDTHAEAILKSEELEDLDISTVRIILERDTLNAKNEIIVFQSLLRWADKECKRKQLPLTPSSKRQILAESVFLPRYLTMSLTEFKGTSGPAQSGIFTHEELNILLRILDHTSPSAPPQSCFDGGHPPEHLFSGNTPIPPTLSPFIQAMATPRNPVLKSQKSPLRFPHKKKRPALFERWLCMKSCCKLLRNSSSPSPATSNHSSPVRKCRESNGRMDYQGPNRSPLHACPTSGPSTLDNAIERIIICWAFFFD